ncbi:hypothetical protein HDV05_006562 [Chytridiales sp. JEL 0842]|nr:hypothetical protein HDV05_006562 [Chytridiales sp. JEL 0842]
MTSYFTLLGKSVPLLQRIAMTLAQNIIASVTGFLIVSMPTAVYLAASIPPGLWGSITKGLVTTIMINLVTHLMQKITEDFYGKNGEKEPSDRKADTESHKDIIVSVAEDQEEKDIDADISQQSVSQPALLQPKVKPDLLHVVSSTPLTNENKDSVLNRSYMALQVPEKPEFNGSIVEGQIATYLAVSGLNIITWFLIIRQPAEQPERFYVSAMSTIITDTVMKLIFAHISHHHRTKQITPDSALVKVPTILGFNQVRLQTTVIFTVLDMSMHITSLLVAAIVIYVFTTAEVEVLPFGPSCHNYLELPFSVIVGRCFFIVCIKTVFDLGFIGYAIVKLKVPFHHAYTQIRDQVNLLTIIQMGPCFVAYVACLMVVIRGILPSSMDEMLRTFVSSVTGFFIVSMPTAVFLAGSSVPGFWGSILKALVSIILITLVTKLFKKIQEEMHENNQRAMANKEHGINLSKDQSIAVLASNEEGNDVPSYDTHNNRDGQKTGDVSIPNENELPLPNPPLPAEAKEPAHLRSHLSLLPPEEEVRKEASENHPALFFGMSAMNIVTWFLILRQPLDNSTEFYVSAVSAIIGDLILKLIFSQLSYLASKKHSSAKTLGDLALICYEISYLKFKYHKVGQQLRTYIPFSKIVTMGPGLLAYVACIMIVMRGILPSSMDETIHVCLLGA